MKGKVQEVKYPVIIRNGIKCPCGGLLWSVNRLEDEYDHGCAELEGPCPKCKVEYKKPYSVILAGGEWADCKQTVEYPEPTPPVDLRSSPQVQLVPLEA